MMDKFVSAYASTPVLRDFDDGDDAARTELQQLRGVGTSASAAAIPRFELPNVHNVRLLHRLRL